MNELTLPKLSRLRLELKTEHSLIYVQTENNFVALLDNILDMAHKYLGENLLNKLILVSNCGDDVITIYNDSVTQKLIELCNLYPNRVHVHIISINPLNLENAHPNIHFTHFPEFHGSYYPVYEDTKIKFGPVNKKFLSLNKRGDVWRQLLYKKFWKDNLLKDSYFSYLCERDNYDHLFHEPTWNKNREYLDNWCPQYMRDLAGPWPQQKFIEIPDDKLLDAYKHENFTTDPTWIINPWWYENTFCSIVIETGITIPYVNLSEKTFRNIAAGQPMLLLGVNGTLQTLRNLGFDTFDDIFDNSYDEEEDVYKRVVMFFEEIDRIAAMNINELIFLKQDMYTRLEANKQVYKKLYEKYQTLNTSIAAKVKDSIKEVLDDL